LSSCKSPVSRGTIEENIKAYNLLKRLRDRKANILYFAYDLNVPFDNNQAEQDLRMEKLRQKISGVIKNFENAVNITKIRSYLKTSRKNNINVLDAFASAFAGNPFIPKRC
jgi:transposase